MRSTYTGITEETALKQGRGVIWNLYIQVCNLDVLKNDCPRSKQNLSLMLLSSSFPRYYFVLSKLSAADAVFISLAALLSIG